MKGLRPMETTGAIPNLAWHAWPHTTEPPSPSIFFLFRWHRPGAHWGFYDRRLDYKCLNHVRAFQFNAKVSRFRCLLMASVQLTGRSHVIE